MVLVTCVNVCVRGLRRKISSLPSALCPVTRSQSDWRGMMLPAGLLDGSALSQPVLLVSWRKVELTVSKVKISLLPSALPGGTRSQKESNGMLVPAASIAGLPFAQLLVSVIWTNVDGLRNSNISSLPSALPGLLGVRSQVETNTMTLPSRSIQGSLLSQLLVSVN